MQLAINVLIFCVGFSIAIFTSLRPKRARTDLDRLIHNVQYVFDALKLRSKETNQEGVAEKGRGAEYLLTTSQVEQRYPEDSWQRQVYGAIKGTLLAEGEGRKTFPCVYATMGFKNNEHRYIFLHSDDPSEPRNIRIIGEALRAYLPQSHKIGKNTSIVIVTPPSEIKYGLEQYRERFWNTLRGLRIYDVKAWPQDIPQDTQNDRWAFAFDGCPIFPVALTPVHEKRHSRYTPSFCIALQPKWVFDHLLSTQTKRDAATKKVRSLLKEYDGMDPSPDLTAYGEPGTSEAHQLFLLDDNEKQAQCPYEDFDQ